MTFFTRERRTARKEHDCVDCGRTILPGELYDRGFASDCGDVWTWKDCAHCRAMLDLCDIAYDGEYSAEHFSEFEPHDFQEMIWKMRWQHGWRHGNGELAAIPKPKEKA